MLESFLTGALAGAAIAIPVGAIAVLIVELGVRGGFRIAAAAGLGAATADGLYAALAAVGGTAAAAILAPVAVWLRVAAVAVLLAVAGRGLVLALRPPRGVSGRASVPLRPLTTYLRFVGLTLLNPQTVIYFSALILGLPDVGRGPAERVAFVGGAYLASASWQTILAGLGSVAHQRLPGRFQLALSVLGNLLIVAFAVGIARDLIA
jgi:threonine/homoserine/homoserine lactone efflux protein